MRASHGAAAGVLLAASLFIVPASGQSLLGGEDSLITLQSGEASKDGAVNLGIGGGDGNIVDANILPGDNGEAADVDVRLGDGLDADVRLLNNTVRGDVDVGGDDDLISVDVGIGDGGGDGNGPGTPGTPGGPNGPGLPGGNGAAGSGGGLAAACAGQDASGLAALIEQTDYSQQALARWQNSRGVEVVQVQFCQDLMARLRALASAGNASVQGAVANDALLSAALDRNGKSVSDILAVALRDNMLTVYVR